jgi:hypothetical protein
VISVQTETGTTADGSFVRLAPVPEALLEQGYRHAVLGFLAKAGGDP